AFGPAGGAHGAMAEQVRPYEGGSASGPAGQPPYQLALLHGDGVQHRGDAGKIAVALLVARLAYAGRGELAPAVADAGQLRGHVVERRIAQQRAGFLQETGVHEAETRAAGADLLLHAHEMGEVEPVAFRRGATEPADLRGQVTDAANADPGQWHAVEDARGGHQALAHQAIPVLFRWHTFEPVHQPLGGQRTLGEARL